jgi:transcriptional regulator with XRE-family HTH domain
MTRHRLSASLPNELLKQARLSRGWSQEDVAGHIGTDGNTFNRWERGRARPSPYFRQKLCTLFDKNAFELGLVPEENVVSPALVPADSKPAFYWHVPYWRNPFFTGREHLLDYLHEQLGPGKKVAITSSSALHGLGGIGKTQTALEYAYRYGRDYTAVFWIEAETTEGISASFLRIAEQLELPERREADQSQIIAAVQRWLAAQHGWLLIWDNVEDLEQLRRWLLPTREGSLLFTTRRRTLGTLAYGIELPTMTPEEGQLFLLCRAKMLPPGAGEEGMHQLFQKMPDIAAKAQELVTTLGGLPLALDQAGAYIEETPCRLEDYIELYKIRRVELLKRRGEAVADHPASVATTWSLSFERIEHANAAAADLLRLCSFLYPDAIPEELFREGAKVFSGERLEAVVTDAIQLQEAFRAITAYSLLKRNVEERTLSIHRLVQAVLWEGMTEQERGCGSGRRFVCSMQHFLKSPITYGNNASACFHMY